MHQWQLRLFCNTCGTFAVICLSCRFGFPCPAAHPPWQLRQALHVTMQCLMPGLQTSIALHANLLHSATCGDAAC